MSLSDLASLGSFVSAVAVLISLVFLYFQLRRVTEQVRQAEKNQRANILQARTNRTAETVLRLCDPSFANAFTKATRGDADLTLTELQQFAGYARAQFLNYEDAFNQHRDGLLGDHAYRAALNAFRQMLTVQGYRAVWRQLLRHTFGPEFVEFVDSLIVQTPVQPPRSSAELLAAWKSELTEAPPPSARS